MNINQKIIDDIQHIAAKYSEIEKIVLFGSRARGDNSDRSDIDLAIFTKNKIFNNWLSFYDKIDEMETLIKLDLVHISENIDKRLLENIENEGCIIMTNENKITNYINATKRLKEALLECGENPTSLNRDGVIQRFEFTSELAWKACREYLIDMGFKDVNGPKPIMREAFSSGLVDNSDAWINILNDRNLTSHIYKEETTIEIFNRIKNIHIEYFTKLSEKFQEMK